MKKGSKKVKPTIEALEEINTPEEVIDIDAPFAVDEFRDAGVPPGTVVVSEEQVSEKAEIPVLEQARDAVVETFHEVLSDGNASLPEMELGVPYQADSVEYEAIKTTILVLQVGVKYLFTSRYNEFLGEIVSLNPLKVIEHSIVGGCQSETELSMYSLDEYTITDIGQDEVFRRLSQA